LEGKVDIPGIETRDNIVPSNMVPFVHRQFEEPAPTLAGNLDRSGFDLARYACPIGWTAVLTSRQRAENWNQCEEQTSRWFSHGLSLERSTDIG
jgi:hypothetical protein